jgi:uncharacterized coiled-coil protein SlyX
MADPADAFSDRFVRLESALMHLTHDFEQMHQVLLAQQRDIQALQGTIEHLQSALDERIAPSSGSEVRDPLAEKPPHY